MSTLELARLPYPVAFAGQHELIGLWRSEWPRTHFDWLEALFGDYADTLAITSIIGRLANRPVATATICLARHAPEVCLIDNVVTLAGHRRQGFSRSVIEAALAEGFAAGCHLALTGSPRLDGNVYERCGFRHIAGNIMGCSRLGDATWETAAFAAGQSAAIRPAAWGDMPGLVLLLAQQLADVTIDSPRGLLSARYADPVRCASAFPVVHDQILQRGGEMLVLASATGSRIFGLGTLTPGQAPGRSHRASIDLATHDNFAAHKRELLSRLRQGALDRKLGFLEAYVPVNDAAKRELLIDAGFRVTARLPAALALRSGSVDVELLELRL